MASAAVVPALASEPTPGVPAASESTDAAAAANHADPLPALGSAQSSAQSSAVCAAVPQGAAPTLAGDLAQQCRSSLRAVPVVALCYAVGWANFAARDALDGSDPVLVGAVAFRVWWEAAVCLAKTPVQGATYLRRKPLMLVVEGATWSVAWGVGALDGLHPLWVFFVALVLSTFGSSKCYDGWSVRAALWDASTAVAAIWVAFVGVACYIAVATSVEDGAAEVLVTGVLYPLLQAALKLVFLTVLVKQDYFSAENADALFAEIARMLEIVLSTPCFVGVLLIGASQSFATSAALAFLCEIVGVAATVARFSPKLYKAEARLAEASLQRVGASHAERRSSTALLERLARDRRRLATKIANEEWAEKIVILVSAPLALALTDTLTATEIAVRVLVLFVFEVVVDAAKTRVCHRFGVQVRDVAVRPGVWGTLVCVATFVMAAWALSVGVALPALVGGA